MSQEMEKLLGGGPAASNSPTKGGKKGEGQQDKGEDALMIKKTKTTNQRIREILVESERAKHASKNLWNAKRLEKVKRVGALYHTSVVEKFVQDRVLHPGTGADLPEKARHTKFSKSDTDAALEVLAQKARQYDPLATHNALKDCLIKELRSIISAMTALRL